VRGDVAACSSAGENGREENLREKKRGIGKEERGRLIGREMKKVRRSEPT